MKDDGGTPVRVSRSDGYTEIRIHGFTERGIYGITDIRIDGGAGVKASAFSRNMGLMCNVLGKNSYKKCKEDG